MTKNIIISTKQNKKKKVNQQSSHIKCPYQKTVSVPQTIPEKSETIPAKPELQDKY